LAGQAEPMHAVYRRQPCLRAVEAALKRGERRMIAFHGDVRVRYVDEPELRRIDPELRAFFNVNTPADLEQARRLATTTPGRERGFGGHGCVRSVATDPGRRARRSIASFPPPQRPEQPRVGRRQPPLQPLPPLPPP